MDHKPAANTPEATGPVPKQITAIAHSRDANCHGSRQATTSTETKQDTSRWHPFESREEWQDFDARLDHCFEKRAAQNCEAAPTSGAIQKTANQPAQKVQTMNFSDQPTCLMLLRNTSDILLDLFVDHTLGSIDHELDDWSDGITDISLYEDNVLLNRRAAWDYFPNANQSVPSNVIPFPEFPLPLSA